MHRFRSVLALLVLCTFLSPVLAEDEVFSGPQVGEKLVGFKTVGVLNSPAGKDVDPIAKADGKPVALVFVHELTRPSAAVIRAIGHYGKSLEKDGLQTYLVWLHADRTAAEQRIKQINGSQQYKVPVVISKDGVDGPGAYGLNRKVTLTILVGKDNKVTANYALIQPSLQADGPKIAASLAKAVGKKPPTEQELRKLANPNQGTREQLVGMLRGVINKDASEEDVKAAAMKVEKFVSRNRRMQRELGRIANIGVERKYGTKPAQEYLKKWAEKFGPKKPNDRP